MANVARSTIIRYACLIRRKTRRSRKRVWDPRRYLGTIMSPWAAKRLHDFGGDITKFRVVKVWPSILEQIAIAKTEPGDENNQIFLRWSGKWIFVNSNTTPRTILMPTVIRGTVPLKPSYGFVEMFKAPIKVLHPLLTATQKETTTGQKVSLPCRLTGLFLPTRTSPNG